MGSDRARVETHKGGYGSQKGELVRLRIDDEVLFWKTPLENGTSCFTGDFMRCEALTGGLGFRFARHSGATEPLQTGYGYTSKLGPRQAGKIDSFLRWNRTRQHLRGSLTRPKTQKRRILCAWRKLLKDFTKREWLSVFVWSGTGIAGAALIRLTLWDHAFEVFLGSKYVPTEKIFDDPRLYLPYLITGAVAVLIGSALRVPALLWRCLRSWWAGVTSGLSFLSSTATFVAFTFGFSSIQRRLIFAAATLVISFSASFILYLKGRVHAEDTPPEDDLRVSSHARSLVGRQWSESDDPIRTWEEDAIGRASLVDSMSVKLMISKSPVLALFGQLGSGKTSTLNLLREHLDDKAIVVSFSTWLPGSQETFTAYLLSDIANECQKHYIVPGLRKSAKRLAKALGKNVPLLRSYFESLPEATQRDDIASIHAALERLPKRVIVLLDELDRMEKEELITLLKVIRGVSHLPNLSFVCAGDFKRIVKTVKGDVNEENIAYFEKFFFDVIEIVSCLSWKWRKRSSVKIAERTYEKRAQALHC